MVVMYVENKEIPIFIHLYMPSFSIALNLNQFPSVICELKSIYILKKTMYSKNCVGCNECGGNFEWATSDNVSND